MEKKRDKGIKPLRGASASSTGSEHGHPNPFSRESTGCWEGPCTRCDEPATATQRAGTSGAVSGSRWTHKPAPELLVHMYSVRGVCLPVNETGSQSGWRTAGRALLCRWRPAVPAGMAAGRRRAWRMYRPRTRHSVRCSGAMLASLTLFSSQWPICPMSLAGHACLSTQSLPRSLPWTDKCWVQG